MYKLILILVTALNASGAFAESVKTNHWKIVPNKEVCMVTNMHFARPQIPVAQNGKTYYGCCDNCKATIQKDATARTATDPVTKKPVDKATATIAADNTGSVLYFENKANFEKYLAKDDGSKQ